MQAIRSMRYILYSGAVRAGKTILGANAAIDTCVNNPGCVGMVGCLTHGQLRDVPFKTFGQELLLYQKALDENDIPIKLAQIKYGKDDMRAKFWNGSEIQFRSCESADKIRGRTLDFAWLDEPIEIEEEIFKELINRISGTGNLKNQFILLTTNPGSQSHWIYQRFIKYPTKNYLTVHTTTYDNVMLPRYSEYIGEIKNVDDPDWVRRFLDGTWDAFSGQIYKMFSRERHVGQYAHMKKSTFSSFYAGVDWGSTNPSCILTLGMRDKQVYVIDEYYQREKPSHYVAKEIAARHAKYNYKKVFLDPSNPDLIQQTYDLGVPADKADRNVHSGIGKVKSLLSKGLLHIDGAKCPNLIREIQMYQYKKDKTGQNKQEEPKKLDDHAPDALRYGLSEYRAFRTPGVVAYVSKNLWDFNRR